mmetsp:Transcript_29891/g.83532  ORF Transcript_29891/g.83532 Transcript_29891/m.83532 type:complete len:244 (-) Transcript_29891:949-1680(-)
MWCNIILADSSSQPKCSGADFSILNMPWSAATRMWYTCPGGYSLALVAADSILSALRLASAIFSNAVLFGLALGTPFSSAGSMASAPPVEDPLRLRRRKLSCRNTGLAWRRVFLWRVWASTQSLTPRRAGTACSTMLMALATYPKTASTTRMTKRMAAFSRKCSSPCSRTAWLENIPRVYRASRLVRKCTQRRSVMEPRSYMDPRESRGMLSSPMAKMFMNSGATSSHLCARLRESTPGHPNP